MIGFKRILCPTDLSEESFKAFPYAFDLARVFDAEIVFISVVNINTPAAVEMGFETTFVDYASAVRKEFIRWRTSPVVKNDHSLQREFFSAR